MEILVELNCWLVVMEEVEGVEGVEELGKLEEKKGQELTRRYNRRPQRRSGNWPATEHAAQSTSNYIKRALGRYCGAKGRGAGSTAGVTLASSSLLQNEQCLTVSLRLLRVSEYHFKMEKKSSHPFRRTK